MKNQQPVIKLLLACILFLSACKTEDIKPIINTNNNSLVSLSADATNISEDGGVAQLSLTLNELSANDVQVFLKLEGKAVEGLDYSCNKSVIIKAGNMQAQLSLLAQQDTLKEGNETVLVSIDSVIGAKENATQDLQIVIEDDDMPSVGNLIINEVLYDPSNTALEGDANGDGVYAQNEDEFVEFYNNSSKPIDVSGYKLFDATGLSSGTPRHVVPAGTIVPPYQAFVVFGGGNLVGSFGNAIVQKSSTGDLNLNNAGDMLTVQDSNGVVMLTFDVTPLSDNPNESYTRNPDITGDFVQHASVGTTKFSPGKKIDNTGF